MESLFESKQSPRSGGGVQHPLMSTYHKDKPHNFYYMSRKREQEEPVPVNDLVTSFFDSPD